MILNNISESNINKLKDNEIFVFGSNLAGIHGAGAAYLAHSKFDAQWKIGIGRVGNTYAIPTKNLSLDTLPIRIIKGYIEEFIQYANYHNQYTYLVTEIGCGLAGYKVEDIAPLFKDAINISCIHLPKKFIEYFNN